MGEATPTNLGAFLHKQRVAAGLSLQRLADAVGCAKSYLSMLETGSRTNPPGEHLLSKLELALSLPPGTLVNAARWQATPANVRRRMEAMESTQRAAAEQLKNLLASEGLDAAYKSGTLGALINRLSAPLGGEGGLGEKEPAEGGDEDTGGRGVARVLPIEVPLINSVAAGYPREFTDLGYPARVADQYVRTPDIHDPDAFAARVVGDSMEPGYHEGDIVVFSPAKPIRDGMDCFIRFERDSETTFKRVFFERESGVAGGQVVRIKLAPLNDKYPTRVVEREEVAGMYAAVSVTRTL